jgi:hypothetical protein
MAERSVLDDALAKISGRHKCLGTKSPCLVAVAVDFAQRPMELRDAWIVEGSAD